MRVLFSSSRTRLRCGCHHKLNTGAETFVLATTLSLIDASLVPHVNRHNVGWETTYVVKKKTQVSSTLGTLPVPLVTSNLRMWSSYARPSHFGEVWASEEHFPRLNAKLCCSLLECFVAPKHWLTIENVRKETRRQSNLCIFQIHVFPTSVLSYCVSKVSLEEAENMR